ncbi:MAG: CotH kinase family protein [Clostridia bacterium]|nr:CotH kinase family protein [Clostridia bacterium]
MKKIIPLIIISALLALCLFLPAFAASAPEVSVTASIGSESASITARDGIFYLPAAVDTEKLLLSFEGELSYKNADGSMSGTLTAGQTLDLTKAKTADERGVPCFKLTLTQNGASADFTFYSDESLASVFVSTSKGLPYIEQSKENRDKGAKITVVNENGSVEYSDTAASTESEIKGRGNATFGYYKKPYQIKLAEKTALLGMDKAKTWILLANYTDQSALHNALAFKLGEALGVPYNIEYNFVNLYIDGEYRGLYMICEKVQVDSSRVDIADLEKATEKANEDVELDELGTTKVTNNYLTQVTIITEYQYANVPKSPEDITGGYLVELDNNYGTREPCYFKTANGNVYVVKSPEYASRAEVEYIARLFANMEEALYSETGYNSRNEHFSKYIDVESFAAVYTVQELMKNWDAYTSSMFFFKDADEGDVQSKIYMGPLWDLDNTLGNINFNKEYGTDTSYLWAQNGVFQNYVRTFAKNLMKHRSVQEVNVEIYAKAYSEVQTYLSADGWFRQMSEKIYSSVMMDRTRWEMYDPDRWLLSSYGYKLSVKFVQFAEYGEWNDAANTTALGFMRYYLSERAEALKETLGKVTAEPPSSNVTLGTTATTATTGTTATTRTSATTATTATTQATATQTAAAATTVPATSNTTTGENQNPGCGGGSEADPLLAGGSVLAAMIGAKAGACSGKKKKETDKTEE